MGGKTLLFVTGLSAGFANLAGPGTADLRQDEVFAELARRHVFMVDYQGVHLDPVHVWKLCGCDKRPCTPWEQFDHINAGLSDFARTNPWPSNSGIPAPRVAVFVHGGLNSYANGLKRLQALRPPMLASNCYPVFVVWNSGLFSTYAEHLVFIRQGERRPVIGPITLPIVLATDLAKGLVRLPLTLSGRLYSDLQTTELPDGRRVRRWEGYEFLLATNRPTQLKPPPPEGRSRSSRERINRTGQYLLTAPSKIAMLPILDAVGAEAWDMMLRRTRTMFEPPGNYEITQSQLRKWGTDRRTPETTRVVAEWLNGRSLDGQSSTGAMHALSRRLVEWSARSYTNLPFDFYGHSMGAIVLNEMFHAHPDIRAGRIAYLGAACSIHDFEDSLFPYLRAHADTHFYSVSLHRVRERDESNFADLPPRGSLLNWIDDIFAKPKTVTDRTLGTWENIVRALPDVPVELIPRTHFRACSILPIESGPVEQHPQAHGDFDQFPFWSEQFLWPSPGTLPPARLQSRD